MITITPGTAFASTWSDSPWSTSPWGGGVTLPGAMFGEESGFVDCDDISTALDGTLHSYHPYNKRRKALKWEYLTTAQKQLLESLWSSGQPFGFSDEVDPDNAFTAMMLSAPRCKQDMYGIWSAEVEIREV